MTRQLPAAMSSTDVFMQVLIGQMDELMGMLRDTGRRLPDSDEGAGVVRLQEPAVPAPAVSAPTETTPEPKPVPEQADDPEPLPEPPPRAGRGSGLEAWVAFADEAGVDYPDGASRNDIIAACAAAKVIDED
jgi:hypothetical protein